MVGGGCQWMVGGRGCKIISFELMMFIGHGMQRVSKASFRGLAFRQRS